MEEIKLWYGSMINYLYYYFNLILFEFVVLNIFLWLFVDNYKNNIRKKLKIDVIGKILIIIGIK